MKKVCLMLAVFSFMSVMPCFAIKMILNNESDRTVPSRSNNSDVQEFIEQESYYDTYKAPQYEQIGNDVADRQKERFNLVYKPILSQDIRYELVGTTWYYPENHVQQNEQRPAEEYNHQENQDNSVEYVYNKRFIREAADYYVVDTINRPNEVIPVGY